MLSNKFKAWDIQKKEWMDAPIIDGANGKAMAFDLLAGEFQRHFSDEEVRVVRSTGLYDGQGSEIFEGDIVWLSVDGDERLFEVCIDTTVRKVQSHPSFADEFAVVAITGVVFKWKGFKLFPCVIDDNRTTDVERMKIVGNVFEDPDLIFASAKE